MVLTFKVQLGSGVLEEPLLSIHSNLSPIQAMLTVGLSVVAPQLWNALALELRTLPSLKSFWQGIETFWFTKAFN